jgi:hypothetical protein
MQGGAWVDVVAALPSHGRSRWFEPNHAHFRCIDSGCPGAPGEGLPSPLVVAMLEMACAGIGRLVHGWGGGGHAV